MKQLKGDISSFDAYLVLLSLFRITNDLLYFIFHFLFLGYTHTYIYIRCSSITQQTNNKTVVATTTHSTHQFKWHLDHWFNKSRHDDNNKCNQQQQQWQQIWIYKSRQAPSPTSIFTGVHTHTNTHLPTQLLQNMYIHHERHSQVSERRHTTYKEHKKKNKTQKMTTHTNANIYKFKWRRMNWCLYMKYNGNAHI